MTKYLCQYEPRNGFVTNVWADEAQARVEWDRSTTNLIQCSPAVFDEYFNTHADPDMDGPVVEIYRDDELGLVADLINRGVVSC